MKPIKLCKDCKHHEYSSMDAIYDKCRRYPLLVDLLRGEDTSPTHYCNIERGADFVQVFIFGKCGKSGKHFVSAKE